MSRRCALGIAERETPPNRWTGRHLGVDAREATRLLPKGEFDEWYAMRYQQACWNAHGSGLAGVRGIPEAHFAGLSALGFRDRAQFALIGAEMVLREVGLWNAEVQQEFDEHYEHRVITKALAMQENRTGKGSSPPREATLSKARRSCRECGSRSAAALALT